MGTFLEFYTTLLGFINYKLYSEINLVYPPKLIKNLQEQAAELDAFEFERIKEDDHFISEFEKQQYSKVDTPLKSLKKMVNLQDKISKIENMDVEELEEESQDLEVRVPKPVVPEENLDEILPSFDSIISKSQDDKKFSSLFLGCKFYLNREVPRYALEFVIRSFGGRVGWDDTVGSASPFKVDDAEITHHIIDRPSIAPELKAFDKREFLQPQWVFDCINAGKILNTDGYHIGEALPNHLSPFVVARDGDYNPTEDIEESENEKESMEDIVTEEQEKDLAHQEELEAEASGVSFADYSSKPEKSKRKVKSETEIQEKENKDLAKIMMSKKDKHLYNQIQYSKKKKAAAVEKLKSKKSSLKGR